MHDYLGPSFLFGDPWVGVNRIVSCAEIQLEPPRLSCASGIAIENRPPGQRREPHPHSEGAASRANR